MSRSKLHWQFMFANGLSILKHSQDGSLKRDANARIEPLAGRFRRSLHLCQTSVKRASEPKPHYSVFERRRYASRKRVETKSWSPALIHQSQNSSGVIGRAPLDIRSLVVVRPRNGSDIRIREHGPAKYRFGSRLTREVGGNEAQKYRFRLFLTCRWRRL